MQRLPSFLLTLSATKTAASGQFFASAVAAVGIQVQAQAQDWLHPELPGRLRFTRGESNEKERKKRLATEGDTVSMWPMAMSQGLQSGHSCWPTQCASGRPRPLALGSTHRLPQRAAALQGCSAKCKGHSWQRRKRWPQPCPATSLPLDEVCARFVRQLVVVEAHPLLLKCTRIGFVQDLPPRDPSSTAVPDCPPSTSGSDDTGYATLHTLPQAHCKSVPNPAEPDCLCGVAGQRIM